MLKKFINFLSCIKCNNNSFVLKSFQEEGPHIVKGQIICKKCKMVYPIIKGVPYLLMDNLEEEEEKTKEDFGWEWLNAEKANVQIPVTDFYFKTYFPSFEDIDLLENKIILDAGCGNGRIIEYSAKKIKESNLVIGVDFSNAVHIAFKKTKEFKNVFILRADLLALPIKKNCIDIVYSLGVIHHVSNPPLAVENLAQASRSNGHIYIWTYSYEGNEFYCKVASHVRKITVKLPKYILWKISQIIASSTWWYLWLCNRFPENLLLGEYLKFIYRLGFGVYWLVIFDQLSPQISFYPNREEILSWVSHKNLTLSKIQMRTKNSWCIYLKKI